jgi:hypothetical protein
LVKSSHFTNVVRSPIGRSAASTLRLPYSTVAQFAEQRR